MNKFSVHVIGVCFDKFDLFWTVSKVTELSIQVAVAGLSLSELYFAF